MSSPATSFKKRFINDRKFTSQTYLKNIDEPKDKPARDKPMSNETILGENSRPMRQRFRQIAHNIKVIKLRRYIDGTKNN
jgi:hypothetical protein